MHSLMDFSFEICEDKLSHGNPGTDSSRESCLENKEKSLRKIYEGFNAINFTNRLSILEIQA